MKKLVTAFALCAAISAMAVESENIVGYQTKSVITGMNMTSLQFFNVGGGSTRTLGTLFSGSSVDANLVTPSLMVGTGINDGDEVQFWDSETGMFVEAFFSDETTTGDPIDENEATNLTGWYDKSWSGWVSDMTVDTGRGFWFVSAGTPSVTFSGQVISTPNMTISCIAGMNMVGFQTPQSFSLNGIDWSSSGAIVGTGINDGDEVQFWDNDTGMFVEAFFTDETTTGDDIDEDPGTNLTGWYDKSWAGWFDYTIQQSQGFWLVRPVAGNIVLPKGF